MTVDIQPVEIAGQFWVEVVMDSQPMSRHGAFATPDEAEAAACRIAAMCRAIHCRGALGRDGARARGDRPWAISLT